MEVAEPSAVLDLDVDPEKIVAEVPVASGAVFARRMAKIFDATSSPTLSTATLVSPQPQEDLLDYSPVADPVDSLEVAVELV